MKARLFVLICSILTLSTHVHFGQVGLINNNNLPDSSAITGIRNSTDIEISYILTWTGILDQNWYNAGNWSEDTLPGSYMSIIIPGSPINQPVLSNNDTCRSLVIQNGGKLTVGDGIILFIRNDLILEQTNPADSTILKLIGDVRIGIGYPPGIIELSFTAINNATFLQLDSIKVMNLSQEVETLLYWPDTILILNDQFPFSPGDKLIFIGYADTLQSGILAVPAASQVYTFQFATNIPCPGMPTVTHDGQVYNTIQIFSQCWLKENLNLGTMIPGNQVMTNNGLLEKYCYNNEPENCEVYGGLYQWNEMMQYTTQPGTQCICPQGWHIPTDQEWKVLEGVADSLYGIGNDEWNDSGLRGFDAGTNLKSLTGWYNNDNGTDFFGFSGLPGGFRSNSGNFNYIGKLAGWWSSTVNYSGTALGRDFDYGINGVYRGNYITTYGYGVRCLRDY